ncbi:MAG: RIP metalloprotease RseP [Nitrospiria bacterium]
MFSASSILTFLAVLGVLVFVHEFGHYIVARMCGVQVETFSLGFGPKILSKKVGPTEYCLSVIPLGGFVRLLGDDPNEEIPEKDREHAFLTQPVRKKIAVVLAGPLFNLILAFFIFSGVFMAGIPILTADVGKIQEGSAAEKGGMKKGDQVLSIEGDKITEWEAIRERLQKSDGSELQFLVKRGSEEVMLKITPTMQETKDVFGDPHPVWLIGILPSGDHTVKRYNPLSALYMGMGRTVEMTTLNVVGIVKMIQGKISSDNIGGPILIAQMAGKQAKEGFLNIVLFVAVLSINLGIINLVPIPILDGGHLVFFMIEGIIGHPLSLKKREIAQQVGLFLIVSLMVFAFYNDIMRFFVNPS